VPTGTTRSAPQAPARLPDASASAGATGLAAPANHPAHEKALVGLWLAIDACREFLDAHAASPCGGAHDCAGASGLRCEGCALCELASDFRGMLFTLELYASRLDDQAAPFAGQLRRLRGEWRDRGTPQAEQILRVLEALLGSAPDKGSILEPEHVHLGGEGSA
jgi:hypothetical protein